MDFHLKRKEEEKKEGRFRLRGIGVVRRGRQENPQNPQISKIPSWPKGVKKKWGERKYCSTGVEKKSRQ